MLLLSCMKSSYILDINPLLNIWFKNISFSKLHFHFDVTLLCRNVLVWCSIICLFFLLLLLPLEACLQKQMSMKLLPICLSRNFMVSGPKFKSLIHLELIFVYGLRYWLRQKWKERKRDWIGLALRWSTFFSWWW